MTGVPNLKVLYIQKSLSMQYCWPMGQQPIPRAPSEVLYETSRCQPDHCRLLARDSSVRQFHRASGFWGREGSSARRQQHPLHTRFRRYPAGGLRRCWQRLLGMRRKRSGTSRKPDSSGYGPRQLGYKPRQLGYYPGQLRLLTLPDAPVSQLRPPRVGTDPHWVDPLRRTLNVA